MKSQRAIAYIVLAAIVGIGAIELPITWAQEHPTTTTMSTGPDANVTVRTTGDKVDEIRVDADRLGVNADEIRKSVERELAAAGINVGDSMESKIRKAAEKLRDAKDDQAKTSARKELGGLLSQYFDKDMDRRAKELLELKERLNRLTAQLERRRQEKQNIIDLQIQVAVNEAEGLGFVTRPAGPAPFDFFYHHGPVQVPVVIGSDDGEASLTIPPVPPVPNAAPNPQPAAKTDGSAE
jgi:hypothetical protein